LEFGGYILIKGIKWELIRIKGELSKELEKSEKQFYVQAVFGRKSKRRAKKGDSDFLGVLFIKSR